MTWKIANCWRPGGERGVRWNDPALGIEWPVAEAILSERDRALPLLAER